jgi:hypothetical protein
MLENLVGLDKLSILQCQELAKDVGYDSATFDLVGPNGVLKAKWLDAYFGLFEIQGEGSDGFLTVQQFQYIPDIYCINLMPKDATSQRKDAETE